jgi:hypothetical protein
MVPQLGCVVYERTEVVPPRERPLQSVNDPPAIFAVSVKIGFEYQMILGFSRVLLNKTDIAACG